MSTRANSLSAALAFFVVAKEANVETLVWLLGATLANIVVVSYDVWLDEGLEVAPALNKAVERLNSKEDCWKAVWTKFGAVLGRTSRVAGVDWKMKIDESPHRFLACEVRIRSSQLSSGGSVMLGLVASQKVARGFPKSWIEEVCSAVAENQVRYICGVFSRGKEDTEKLFKDLNLCEGALFFQPFWTEDADGDADGSSDASRLTDEIMDAVAARFEMGVPKNVKLVAVYPAYVVVRGPSQDVSVPLIMNQPSWPNDLFPHGSGIEKGLGRLVDVPRLPQEKSEVDLQYSLPLRQKQAPIHLWRKGVHQLLLWLGSSRPSEKCQKKNVASKAWYYQRPMARRARCNRQA